MKKKIPERLKNDVKHGKRVRQPPKLDMDAGRLFKCYKCGFYKRFDNRCLKPVKNKPPREWPHYDMEQFRAAKTEEELKNITEIPFDINVFNFEDPKVYKKFMDIKRGPNMWKKVYGFDTVKFGVGYRALGSMLLAKKDCLKAEYSKFAQKCNKNMGFFKCCMFG